MPAEHAQQQGKVVQRGRHMGVALAEHILQKRHLLPAGLFRLGQTPVLAQNAHQRLEHQDAGAVRRALACQHLPADGLRLAEAPLVHQPANLGDKFSDIHENQTSLRPSLPPVQKGRMESGTDFQIY